MRFWRATIGFDLSLSQTTAWWLGSCVGHLLPLVLPVCLNTFFHEEVFKNKHLWDWATGKWLNSPQTEEEEAQMYSLTISLTFSSSQVGYDSLFGLCLDFNLFESYDHPSRMIKNKLFLFFDFLFCLTKWAASSGFIFFWNCLVVSLGPLYLGCKTLGWHKMATNK